MNEFLVSFMTFKAENYHIQGENYITKILNVGEAWKLECPWQRMKEKMRSEEDKDSEVSFRQIWTAALVKMDLSSWAIAIRHPTRKFPKGGGSFRNSIA